MTNVNKWSTGFAKQVTGIDAETGNRLQLDGDVLVHISLSAIEQGALERIAMSDDTLYDEIYRAFEDTGHFTIGEPETTREYLHDLIDQMFSSIYVQRGIITKEEAHNIRQGKDFLDDVLDRKAQPENVEK